MENEENTELHTIVQGVADFYGLDPFEMIKNKTRKRNYAYPRYIAMHLMRNMRNEGVENIARIFKCTAGNVSRGVQRVRKEMAKNGAVAAAYPAIMVSIQKAQITEEIEECEKK